MTCGYFSGLGDAQLLLAVAARALRRAYCRAPSACRRTKPAHRLREQRHADEIQVLRSAGTAVEAAEIVIREHVRQLIARFGRKLKKMTASIRLCQPTSACQPRTITVGTKNSSVYGVRVRFLDRTTAVGTVRTLRRIPWHGMILVRDPTACRGPSRSSACTVASVPTPTSSIFALQLLQVADAAVRRNVASVQERVNVYFARASPSCASSKQREQMRDMAMHAAVGQQAVRVKLLAVRSWRGEPLREASRYRRSR